MNKKRGHQKAAKKTRAKHTDNSAESQRYRLVEWLKEHGSITTIEARRDLDILAPAPRVFELREMDYPIDTVWVHGFTEQGNKHRIARYVWRGAAHE